MCKRWKLGQLIWGGKRYLRRGVGKSKVTVTDLNLEGKILSQKRKTRENVGPLLNIAGPLITTNTEKPRY